MNPVDFSAVIEDIKAKGGFDAGAFSKAVSQAYGTGRYHEFRFPGEPVYKKFSAREANNQGNTPTQDDIDYNFMAQHMAQSIYADANNIALHVCQFVRGDFRRNMQYRDKAYYGPNFLKNLSGTKALNEHYAFQFSNAARKSQSGGKYFTYSELDRVQAVLADRPDFSETFVIYQAAFVDYFKNLSDAIHASADLTKEERDIGYTSARYMQGAFSGSFNFMDSLLPAFCLKYDEADPAHKSQPDVAMFEQSFRFGMSLGMFRARETMLDGNDVTIRCPGQRTLMDLSTHGENQAGTGTHKTMSPGTMLAMIHKHVQTLPPAPEPKPVYGPRAS